MYAIIEKSFVAYLRYSGEIIAGEICHRRQFFNQSQREFFYEPDCEHEKTGKTRQLQKFCFHCNSPLPKKFFSRKAGCALLEKTGECVFRPSQEVLYHKKFVRQHLPANFFWQISKNFFSFTRNLDNFPPLLYNKKSKGEGYDYFGN